MADLKKIPTLNGWVDDVAKASSYLLSSFITANYSQTVLYEEVTSLQYILQRRAGDKLGITTDIKAALDRLFSNTFGMMNIELNVGVEAIDESQPQAFTITVRMRITVNGERHSLGRVIQYDGSSVVAISKLMNG